MAEAHKNAVEKWMLSMEVMLESLSVRDVQACSIPIVPPKLRNPRDDAYKPKAVPVLPVYRSPKTELQNKKETKEDAYKPKVVSIGPLHRSTKAELLYMEEPKWRCVMSLMGRIDDQNKKRTHADKIQSFKDCSPDILDLEEIVRGSYVSKIKWNSFDLAKIMLLDGCFLLELLMSSFEDAEIHQTNGPAAKLGKNGNLLSDLLVLENQLPFFILKKLSIQLFPKKYTWDNSKCETELVEMALKLFGYSSHHIPNFKSGVAHLLHLVHTSITRDDKIYTTEEAEVELKHCATRLQARGVQIKAYEEPVETTSTFFTRFVKWLRTLWANEGEDSKPDSVESHMTRFDFGISFNKDDGVLEIPPLRITETTEANWRNFIAWEQSKTDWRNSPDWDENKDGINCKFTSYAFFFRGLICCVHDIELLREKKVIIVDNPKKGNHELLTLFHKITEGVEHMDSSYAEDCKNLNGHSTTNPVSRWTLTKWHQLRSIVTDIIYLWENWYGILKRDHMPTVWKTLGVLAAVFLLFLTVTQTVLAALAL